MAEDSGGFQDMELMVMDRMQTFKYDEWEASREMAEEMLAVIPGLKENFYLDQITMGNGECFHTSVHQQLRRTDIQNDLSKRNRQLSRNSDMRAFKSIIGRFMNTNNHTVVKTMKEEFQIFMEGTSWDKYWSSKNLLRKEFWADEVFIRATAWFLKLDIVIHQNVPGAPEKVISGNIDNDSIPCDGPKLHIGYLIDKHYQSLIPRKGSAKQPVVEESDEASTSLLVENIQPSNTCPVCKKTFKKVLNHMRQAKSCKNLVSENQIQYFQKISDDQIKEKKRNRKRKAQEEDSEKVKEDNKRWKAAERAKRPEKAKEDNRRWKAAQKEKDPEKMKKDDRKR